jgi:hypothetical protein
MVQSNHAPSVDKDYYEVTKSSSLDVYEIEYSIDDKGGALTSCLSKLDPDKTSKVVVSDWDWGVGILEYLLLNLAIAGVDIDTPAVKEAIETTVDYMIDSY